MVDADDERADHPEPLPGFDSEPVRKKPPLSWWICIPIGFASAIIGLLPWLITGMHLPIQELWEGPATAETMPIVLLPFSYFAVVVIFGLIVMGSAVAGVATRATRPLQRRGGPFWIAIGLLAIQLLAVAQTYFAVVDGLQQRSLSWLYLAAMVGVSLVSIVIGVPVLLLIANAPRAGATIGISVASVAAAAWLVAFLTPAIAPPEGGGTLVADVLRWVPPVIVGVALAWGGLNTVGRILAAPVCLAILWVAPTVFIAAGTAAAHPQLLELPDQIVQRAVRDILEGLTVLERAVPPIVVALVVAGLGLVVRWLWGRTRRGSRHETVGDSGDSAQESPAKPDSAMDQPAEPDTEPAAPAEPDTDPAVPAEPATEPAAPTEPDTELAAPAEPDTDREAPAESGR